jgi:hypothetical protein
MEKHGERHNINMGIAVQTCEFLTSSAACEETTRNIKERVEARTNKVF